MKLMKIKNYIGAVALLLLTFACKDQLNVGNPNAPTLGTSVTTEAGLITLAQGTIYVNGFQNGENVPAYNWLGDTYFSLPYGYAELLGDVVGADAANELISIVNVPDYVILDDGVTKITNNSPAIPLLRTYNTRAQTGAGYNPTYFQWLNAYAMNGGCNYLLSRADEVLYTGDAGSKANTIKAWAYWWKGWAYAAVGSLYYSGLLVEKVNPDGTNVNNNDYVTHDLVIAASNKFYNKADSVLSLVTVTTDYDAVIGNLIPQFFQVGHGKAPSVAEWKRNIKTMLARNIVVNNLSPFVNGNPAATITTSSTTAMSNTDWNNVLTLATAGIQSGDNVFAGRSTDTNPVFSTSGGTISAMTAGTNKGSTFKISERFLQFFKPGDKRFSGNFVQDNLYSNQIFGTRFSLLDAGVTPPPAGTYAYSNLNTGGYELFIGSSYEENALMLAEANIRLGNIDAGLAYVDAVRTYQGAGLTAVSGTGLTLAQAMNELVSERRVALVFRGLSFYDARRWGWTYDISNGGGAYGMTFVETDGTVNTNATISYNFLDYWDVPADEWVLNPRSATGAEVKNPNF